MTNHCELCWQSRILSHESLLEVRLNSFDAIGYSSCSCSHSFSGTREFPTGKHLKLIHIFSWKSPRISVEIFYSLSLILCPYNPLFRISALPTTGYLIFSHFSLILSLLRVIVLESCCPLHLSNSMLCSRTSERNDDCSRAFVNISLY